jgi:predicted DNA-binding transcriptional regulator YafY
VRYRASGVQEMCWHLFTWGTAVTVMAADSLRSMMADMTMVAAQHHSAPITQCSSVPATHLTLEE